MLRILYLIFAVMSLLLTSHHAFADEKTTLLVWGDSLSAAFGIPKEQGWVALLQNRLGEKYEVINGSISGETSAGGLTRLPKALADYQPRYVLIELGANDGLRGIPLETLQSNLDAMIKHAKNTKATVILIGVVLPPNFGPVFDKKFSAVYARLAKKYSIPLVPRLLENVSENWALMQADGLHPTAKAQEKILENVWKVLADQL